MMVNFQKFIESKRVYAALAVLLVLIIVLTLELLKNPKNELAEQYKLESTKLQEQQINPINFQKLTAVNSDVCAWIHIPGSEEAYGAAIDYPILQSSREKPEDFYLNHDTYGKSSKDGSIYIQKFNHNNFSDYNTVIYGHDLANKQMFTPLRKYRNRDFFDKNQYIYIYLPDRLLKYHIFAAFVHSDSHLLYEYDFNDEDSCGEFLSECENPASKTGNYRKEANVTTEDRLITLSTCTSNKGERFLVVALLSEEIIYK